MYEDYVDEDPQVALRRPMRLLAATRQATSSREGEQTSSVAPPVIEAGKLTDPDGVVVHEPQVQALSKTGTEPGYITASQEYVNKVVQGLGALRSAVVSRRPSPVLNERSFR